MSDSDGEIGALVVMAVVVGWILAPASWTNAVWYGIKYQVGLDHVSTDPKPTDCDWSRSPLGEKGCHYQQVVHALNASGALVDGDDAPRYSVDAKGVAITSYDSGKTWYYLNTPMPDRRIKSVAIGWLKIKD